MNIPAKVKEFIACTLSEDIGNGDITTEAIVPKSKRSKAQVIAKQSLVVAGLQYVKEVFRQVDPLIKVITKVKDSEKVKKGTLICIISGPTASILKGERVALNIIQRLSGVATLTAQLVKRIKGYPARVVDTRKTTPCMRYMEKEAVRMGGGHNHRFGLYDAILIKDNHVEAAGSIMKAVKKVKNAHHLLNVVLVS